MSRRGDHVQQVTGLLSGLAEDGTYTPPPDDENYVPDIENSGEQEIDLEEEDVVTENQEIDQEEDTLEDNDEVEDEEQESEEDTTAEERDVETINELAQFLDVDESQLYDVKIPMGDGLEPISIGELKDGHMEIERQRAQIQNDRAAFSRDVEQFKQSVQQSQNLPLMNEEFMESAIQMKAIQQQFESIDWNALEEEDASKALLYQNKLERAYSEAKHKHDAIKQKMQDEQKKKLDTIKVQSRQAILDKIPEWKDPKVFQKEGDLIGNILVKYGYTSKEIEKVYDPRLSLILRDFMKLSVKNEKANSTVKKLRIAPKKLSSAGSNAKKIVKKAQLKKTVNKAMSSKNIKDKVSAVSQLLNNS